MGLWLFLDALLAHKERDRGNPYYEDERRRRVARAGIASVLLWYVFPKLCAGSRWLGFETNQEGNCKIVLLMWYTLGSYSIRR